MNGEVVEHYQAGPQGFRFPYRSEKQLTVTIRIHLCKLNKDPRNTPPKFNIAPEESPSQ